jgi:hypothetical protein
MQWNAALLVLSETLKHDVRIKSPNVFYRMSYFNHILRLLDSIGVDDKTDIHVRGKLIVSVFMEPCIVYPITPHLLQDCGEVGALRYWHKKHSMHLWRLVKLYVYLRAIAIYWFDLTSQLYALNKTGFVRDKVAFQNDFVLI